jgi:hypothetical protein
MKELSKSNANSTNKFWSNKGKSKIQPNQQKGQGNSQTNFIQEGPSKSKAQEEEEEEEEDDNEQIISVDVGSDDEEDAINYLEDFDEDDLDDLDSINMESTNQSIRISKKLLEELRKEAWEQVLDEEEEKEDNIQQYQRRKQVEQDKNTKWGSSTLPLAIKNPLQQSSPHNSSNSTTTYKEDIMDLLNKLKVPIPLSWLVQFPFIRSQVHDFSNFKEEMSKDPPIILNSRLIGRKGGSHALFYVTMIIGDKMLHNAMLDSGASANIMPYSVMKSLNL